MSNPSSVPRSAHNVGISGLTHLILESLLHRHLNVPKFYGVSDLETRSETFRSAILLAGAANKVVGLGGSRGAVKRPLTASEIWARAYDRPWAEPDLFESVKSST